MSDGAGVDKHDSPAPGSRFGPYTIVETLGAGGMGEVFRARDAKLNRHVALKFLPEELSSDEQLLARFQREAKLLAMVSHPNIATIHSIEDEYDHTFLVLELVEGETLSAILKGGPLMLREALRVCRDIAAAVEAAHRKGVVHRDLKPANVIVTGDGIVKVLDFGIARPLEYTQAASDLEQTPSQELTATGTIIGTGPYMSPEQVRGKAAGRRADIWAFGCLMYQTLTGRVAFESDTLADTLTSILEREPNWEALPARTPESIRRMLKRCLEKDPSRRLQAIGDARIEIDDAIRDRASGGSVVTGTEVPVWKLAAGAAAVLLVGALIGWLAAVWLGPPEEPPPTEWTDLALPDGVVLGLGGAPSIKVSRDGNRFVAVLHDGNSRMLYRRDLDSPAGWTEIAETEGAEAPFFSWSGDEVGYFANGRLFQVPYDGGAGPSFLADAPEPYGGTWSADGTIYFSSNQSIWAGRSGTRGKQPVAEFDVEKGELGLRWPTLLPDGVTLLYTAWHGPDSAGNTLYLRRANGDTSILLGDAGYARYSGSGHLIFMRDTELMAIPYDGDSSVSGGQAVPLDIDVLMRTDNGVPFFDVAADTGTLIHAPGDVLIAGPVLARMDATDTSVPQPLILDNYYESVRWPRLSSDGEVAAAVEQSPSVDREDGSSAAVVFSFAESQNPPEDLLPGSDSYAPEWAPTGGSVAFATPAADGSGQGAIRIKPIHTTATGTVLVDAVPQPVPTGWARDGTLFYNTMDFTDGDEVVFAIWYVSTAADGATPRLLIDDDYDNYGATPSPDGSLVAYVRRLRGQERTEVVVTGFPHTDTTPIRTVSPGSDCQEPTWSALSDRLFFRCDTTMMSVDIDPVTLQPSNQKALWDWPFALDDVWAKANYAYDARTETLVMVSAEPIVEALNLRFAKNWRPLALAAGR